MMTYRGPGGPTWSGGGGAANRAQGRKAVICVNFTLYVQ